MKEIRIRQLADYVILRRKCNFTKGWKLIYHGAAKKLKIDSIMSERRMSSFISTEIYKPAYNIHYLLW